MLLHQLFYKTAKQNKKLIAVFDYASNKAYTYNDVLLASMLIADFCQNLQDKHIGVLMPSSTGCVITVFGIMFANKVPVMINYSTGATENCNYAMHTCHFKKIITSKKLVEYLKMPSTKNMVFIEDILAGISKGKKIKSVLPALLPKFLFNKRFNKQKPDDTAIILFTSGSEKDPKAVELSHKNFVSNINSIKKAYKLSNADAFISTLPWFHVFGLTVTMFLPLTLGAKLVAVPNPLDYKAICKSVKKHRVSVLVSTPTFYWGYLRKAEKDDFEHVKFALAGADKLTKHLHEAYFKKHNINIFEGYGTTETSPVVSVNTPKNNKLGSVGKPLPDVKVKITDIKTGKHLVANEVGKILVKGDLVMNGYFENIEETSIKIRDGWYDTGDMGMLDEEGYLFHMGRLKRFVKIGGEMISLVKAESALEEILPDSELCCIVTVPDQIKGASLIAVITAEGMHKNDIIKALSKKLPPIYVPKKIMHISDLPVMPSGKVNFRKVQKLVEEKLGII